jgi:hypothetical protein
MRRGFFVLALLACCVPAAVFAGKSTYCAPRSMSFSLVTQIISRKEPHHDCLFLVARRVHVPGA